MTYTMHISSVCRVLVRYLGAAHIAFLAWANLAEMGACDGMELPTASVFSDVGVARERTFRGAYFYAAGVLEIGLMCLCILLSRPVHGMHDLKGAARWLPAAIIVLNMCYRARYVYSTPYDGEACDALQCPTTQYSFNMPGCTNANGLDAFTIDWNIRRNWCPIPEWYRYQPLAATLCGGLKGTPDVDACYRYGCTPLAPVRYNMVRVLIWNAFLFALVALVPYRSADGAKGVEALQEANTDAPGPPVTPAIPAAELDFHLKFE